MFKTHFWKVLDEFNLSKQYTSDEINQALDIAIEKVVKEIKKDMPNLNTVKAKLTDAAYNHGLLRAIQILRGK